MSNQELEGLKIPNHVAIILDGNGRWAKKRFLPRNAGHAVGAKNMEKICRIAHDIGIKYLTVYAFSTENWNRPQDEVDAIMKLLNDYLETCITTANDNLMRVRVIGDKTRLSQDMQNGISDLEVQTANNPGINFNIAINYGGRDEIIRAIRNIICDAKDNKIDVESFTNEVFSEYLDTKGVPDPDLLIRTSGEERLSNFLLWQLAYTEFYFTDVLWPDFSKKELIKAIERYSVRNRRFGDIKSK